MDAQPQNPPTAIGRLLEGHPILYPVAADYVAHTVTCRVYGTVLPDRQYIAVPVRDARAALDAEVATPAGAAALPAPQAEYADHGADTLDIGYAGGGRLSLYRERQPDQPGLASWRGPWVWWALERRVDTQGRIWSNTDGRYVMDDFGALVPVGA